MRNSKFIKICPQCGSINITIPPAGLDIKMIFPDYCRDCNNRGLFPEINIEDIDSFRKALKQRNKE